MEEAIQEKSNESGLNIRNLFGLFWRNIILMIVIVAVVSAGGLILAFMQKPTYTATRTFNVMFDNNGSQSSGNNQYNNITVAKVEMPTIIAFFKTQMVLVRANEIYAETGSTGKIRSGSITAKYDKADTPTRIATVSYTDVTPELATKKATALFDAEKEILDDPANELFNIRVKIKAVDEGQTVLTTNSKRSTYVLGGILLGIALAVAVVLIKYFMDDTVKTVEDLERLTGVKMLAKLEGIAEEDIHHNETPSTAKNGGAAV